MEAVLKNFFGIIQTVAGFILMALVIVRVVKLYQEDNMAKLAQTLIFGLIAVICVFFTQDLINLMQSVGKDIMGKR